MLHIPRIVIAGTHSGCGKTTVARGLMGAFRKRGLAVQPFKVGPDFIDPSHHTEITGRVSRNLDPFMMGEEGVRSTFIQASAGADIAIIEGVMGMYDGVDGSALASTADVIRILSSPAILVVDVRGMSRSAHAVVGGFRSFSPDLDLKGVIFNRVGSQRHRAMIEYSRSLPPFGFIPRDPGLGIGSRHLGLKMGFEVDGGGARPDLVGESCDMDAIRAAAESAPPLAGDRITGEIPEGPARIGIARDAAFCFYYQDNLDALRRAGSVLVPFSPCKEPPPLADAYYFGGGYPELHARDLSASPCRERIRAAADQGIPVFGECGGLLYLADSLEVEGTEFHMAGILPGDARMTGRIQALGYSEGVFAGGPGISIPGCPFRGHEFHYSTFDPDRDARYTVRLSRGRGIADGRDGIYTHETVGAYTHTYFSPGFAASFIKAALQSRSS